MYLFSPPHIPSVERLELGAPGNLLQHPPLMSCHRWDRGPTPTRYTCQKPEPRGGQRRESYSLTPICQRDYQRSRPQKSGPQRAADKGYFPRKQTPGTEGHTPEPCGERTHHSSPQRPRPRFHRSPCPALPGPPDRKGALLTSACTGRHWMPPVPVTSTS